MPRLIYSPDTKRERPGPSPATAPDWVGPGRGPLHHGHHLITFPADNELKLGWHQRVQADVDGTETCFLKRRQQPG